MELVLFNGQEMKWYKVNPKVALQALFPFFISQPMSEGGIWRPPNWCFMSVGYSALKLPPGSPASHMVLLLGPTQAVGLLASVLQM